MSKILEKYTSLTIEHSDISDYAEEITDKQYEEMEECEDKIKQALKLQELIKEKITLRTALKNSSYTNKAYTYNDVLDHEIGILEYVLMESEK